MTAAEMTDALVEINDRLAAVARAREVASASFYCECGNCLAEEVALSVEEHEEIRDREDLIFVPGHDAPRRYRAPRRVGPGAFQTRSSAARDRAAMRRELVQRLVRTARVS
jgi:hypothetical protein